MLEYLQSERRDPVFTASLLRLMQNCKSETAWPEIRKALQDPSPLVRAAAAQTLTVMPTEENVAALIRATRDDVRLVRVRAAAGLAGIPLSAFREQDRENVQRATDEHLASLVSRPDLWSSHYNMGNFLMGRGQFKRALNSYERALILEPAGPLPHGERLHGSRSLGEPEGG